MAEPTEEDLAAARKWARKKWGNTFDGYPVEIDAYAAGLARGRADALPGRVEDWTNEDYDALQERMEHPDEPTPALIELMKRHSKDSWTLRASVVLVVALLALGAVLAIAGAGIAMHRMTECQDALEAVKGESE